MRNPLRQNEITCIDQSGGELIVSFGDKQFSQTGDQRAVQRARPFSSTAETLPTPKGFSPLCKGLCLSAHMPRGETPGFLSVDKSWWI